MSSRPSLALVVMCSLLGDAVGPRDKRHGVHGLAAGLLDDAAVGEVAVARHHVAVGLADGGGHLLRHVAGHLVVPGPVAPRAVDARARSYQRALLYGDFHLAPGLKPVGLRLPVSVGVVLVLFWQVSVVRVVLGGALR